MPSFDIPPANINQDARELRIYNHTTEDDHGIRLPGLLRQGDHDWFLIKDSSRSAQRKLSGYYFYRDDSMRLKLLTFMVHKDPAKALLAKVH